MFRSILTISSKMLNIENIKTINLKKLNIEILIRNLILCSILSGNTISSAIACTRLPRGNYEINRLHLLPCMGWSQSHNVMRINASDSLAYSLRVSIAPQSEFGIASSFTSWLNEDFMICCLAEGNVYMNWLNSVIDKEDDEHPELTPGGHWKPTWCIPRQRIAIIVPYRDRPFHLNAFIRVIHPFMQRQLHYYTIFVIEQVHFWSKKWPSEYISIHGDSI